MTDQVGLAAEHHAWMYLAALCGALPAVAFLVRKRRESEDPRLLLAAMVVLTVMGLLGALWASSIAAVGAGLVVFFTGFTAMETVLPALVSVFAPVSLRGTAMGIFSSAQFLGVFAGGAVGGNALQWGGAIALAAVLAILTLAWLIGLWRYGRAPSEAV